MKHLLHLIIHIALGSPEGITSDPISVKPGTRWDQWCMNPGSPI